MAASQTNIILQSKITALELEAIKKDAVIENLRNRVEHLESRTVNDIRLPDPPIFDIDKDGNQTIKYTIWELQMRQKLKADSNASEDTRIAYIASRLGDKPACHLIMRMEPMGEAIDKWKDVDEVLEHLREWYSVDESWAHDELMEIEQGEKELFRPFWEKLQLLYAQCGESGKASFDVNFLADRLSYRYRSNFPKNLDRYKTVQDFAMACMVFDQELAFAFTF